MQGDDELKAGWAGAREGRASSTAQPVPVVRPIYLPALVLQVVAVGLLGLLVSVCVPAFELPVIVMIAAATYMVGCRAFRAMVAHDHIQGMKAYKASRFEEAVRRFEASHRSWCSHRTLDAWRSLYGIASYNSYRVMSLLNAAFCYAQLGNTSKAIGLYKQVLLESPGNALALTSLRMLAAVPPATSEQADSQAGTAV